MRYVIAFAACALIAAPPPAKKMAPPAAAAAPVVVKTPGLARVVQYGPRDTIELVTRQLYSTMIVLPEKEKIAEVILGDKNLWQVTASQNHAWVKPSENNQQTNLHLNTLSGNAYSFFLVSDGSLPADFKIFVDPKDEGLISAMNGPPKLVEASAVAGLKDEIERLRIESFQIKKEAQEKIAEAKTLAQTQAPARIKHAYRFVAHARPFNIRAIWHDDKFTYIQASPDELPSLYEIRDDKPNIVKFEFSAGLYTIDKVMENGYLQIGKQKTGFERIN